MPWNAANALGAPNASIAPIAASPTKSRAWSPNRIVLNPPPSQIICPSLSRTLLRFGLLSRSSRPLSSCRLRRHERRRRLSPPPLGLRGLAGRLRLLVRDDLRVRLRRERRPHLHRRRVVRRDVRPRRRRARRGRDVVERPLDVRP